MYVVYYSTVLNPDVQTPGVSFSRDHVTKSPSLVVGGREKLDLEELTGVILPCNKMAIPLGNSSWLCSVTSD
jgi:hypothetical protein